MLFSPRSARRRKEYESIAERHRSAAEALKKQGSTTGKELKQLLDKDYEAWNEHVRNQTAAVAYRDQLSRIEKLILIVQQEFINPWTRIKDMLNTLRLAVSRDEESYYRAQRARASVGPLKWFRQNLILPNQERLLREVLLKLIEESRTWAALEPKEVSARFYDLCTEAIHRYFQNEPDMNCDRLLAECFEHPSGKYKTEVAVLLARAQATWEIHESYSMRDNRLEISAIGVRQDSILYGTVRESWRQISPVDEQRDDYVPILRTEHGISLAGLKSLPAYRNSLLASVVEEQRYDLHFFNDRRWVTRPEFESEDPKAQHNLYLFSTANLLGLIQRSDGKDYIYNNDHAQPPVTLCRYRIEAFRAFCGDEANLGEVGIEVLKNEAEENWREKLTKHIATLETTLEGAYDPKQ